MFPSNGLKEASSVTSVKEPASYFPGSEDAQTLDPLEVQKKNIQKKKYIYIYIYIYQYKPVILWFTVATLHTSASILKTDPRAIPIQCVYAFHTIFRINNNYFLEQSGTVCLSFYFFVSRLGIGGRYFPSLSFCFDLVALPVYYFGNVYVIECNSSCIVFQFATVSWALNIVLM